MKKILSIFGLSMMAAAPTFAQQTCATAQLITAGTYTIATINGTDVPAVACATGGTGATAANWYKYTPTQNHSVTVTTDFVANGNVDNRVHIYSGACGALSCVGGDDDSGTNLLCLATFTAMANNDYYIVFDNKWSSNGFMFELIEGQVTTPDTNLVAFTPINIATIAGTYKIAVADMNADYLDDIVSVSNNNIQVHFQGANGTFSNANFPTTNAQNEPSWSMAIGDYNADGYNDLLYGGGGGVTFMKSDGSGTGYTQSSGSEYVFSQRSNFIDINNDGHLDAFVCHDVAPNVYYINDGSGNLTFNQGGIGDHPNGGNYGSIWVDYNNDGLPDMFIAKCRGGATTAKINELHRNNGDGTFTNVALQANLADSVQTWSSAWNDYDNDGWMDVIVGASSNADGMHKFMRNNGDGTFTDITAGSGWDSYAGLNIEYVSYDFNNDGFADVLTNNTLLYNNGDNTFTPHPVTMIVGAVGDLNNDGFLDVQNNNSIYYNSGNDNNWLTVTLEGVASNRNGIGARVEIYGAWGKQIRDIRSGVGFRHMGTLNAHFGVGTATEIDSVIVRWPSGNVDLICQPDTNTVLHIIENTAPIVEADFTASATQITETETVDFTDASTPCPTRWTWSVDQATGWAFTNGTTATTQHPSILFDEPGTYIVSLVAGNANGTSSNLVTDTIHVYPLLSGLVPAQASNISIYPNPATDQLYIESNQTAIAAIRLVSILGVELEAHFNQNDRSLSVAHLAPGAYFLSITTETGQVFSTRFVKR